MITYTFKIHILLYVFLIVMVGLGIYNVVVEHFWFAYVNITIFGIPLLLLLIVQGFQLNSLEVHPDKVVFGFFKRTSVQKKDIIGIELVGNPDINNIHAILHYNQNQTQKQYNILKTYNVKLLEIYRYLNEYIQKN